MLRFANSIFEPLFNQKYIDHVQITVAEEEGVGTRAGYYEQAGALRDMVQNHILQLVALVAMEPPRSVDADVVRDEKLEVIQSLRPIAGAAVEAQVVRAQYAAGFEAGVAGARIPSRSRASNPQSRTETFVALQVFIDNWRWAGVPFFLRTGKRLPKRASEISIHLKGVPPILFNTNPRRAARCRTSCPSASSPTKDLRSASCRRCPVRGSHLYPVKMDFQYGSTFGKPSPEAYERLLLDVMAGDPTLFMRRDAVEASWQWVTAILDGWAEQRRPAAAHLSGRRMGTAPRPIG